METIYFEGLEYKEVRSKTGRIWLDRNYLTQDIAQNVNDIGGASNYWGINKPNGYRLPTMNEWIEEIDTWESSDYIGAYKSVLKLPSLPHNLIDWDDDDSYNNYFGDEGHDPACYWTQSKYNEKYIYCLFLNEVDVDFDNVDKRLVKNARFIKDDAKYNKNHIYLSGCKAGLNEGIVKHLIEYLDEI